MRGTAPHRTSIGGPVDDDTPVNEAGGAATVFPLLPHVRALSCLQHSAPSPQPLPLPSILPHSDHTPAPSVKSAPALKGGVSGVRFQNKTPPARGFTVSRQPNDNVTM